MKKVRTDANVNSPLYLGLNLQTSFIQAGLGDGFQLLLADLGQPVEHGDSAQDILPVLCSIWESAQMIAADLASQIHAVGLAAPAAVHPVRGHLTLTTENNPMWAGLAIAEWLQQELGVPVIVEPEVIATATVELKIGAARGAQDALIVKIDTAVKAAYWRNGEFVRGANGFFGNIGHIATGNSDLPCSCGHLGCLEASVATDAILDRFFVAMEEAELELDDEEMPESAEGVFKLSQQNHAVARAVLDDVAFDLGAGLASVINIINPAKMVIAGDPVYRQAEFFEQMMQDVTRRILPVCASGLQLARATVNENSECLGAMMLAQERFA